MTALTETPTRTYPSYSRNILQRVEGIKFFEFSDRDVVRHPDDRQ